MKKVKESCGVLGAYTPKNLNILDMLIYGLQSQQHRGQESWGIGLPEKVFKTQGLVIEGYYQNSHYLSKFKGNCGIGHVRYSTKGSVSLRNAHPIEGRGFSIAHNGTIANFERLESHLKVKGVSAKSCLTDTEMVAERLSILLKRYDWFESFRIIGEELDGSYCFTIVTEEGEVMAVRDPKGFRPLTMGRERKTLNLVTFASESCVIDYLNARFDKKMVFSDVEPGTITLIGEDGVETQRFSDETIHAHCSFEYTYFANASSHIEGINIYEARENCGRELGKLYGKEIRGDVVIPIPDTARPAAIGFSEEVGIPYREGLIKDRYRRRGSLRSFIQPSKREQIVREMIPIKPIIEGKNVVVVDDSIVRGTTSREIVKRLKTSGAKSVQWFLVFPPIQFPCYQGIDFPTREELLVPTLCGGRHCQVEDANTLVEKYLDVNFLGYNTVEVLSKGIGLDKSELCSSCATGDYGCLKSKPTFKTRKEMKG